MGLFDFLGGSKGSPEPDAVQKRPRMDFSVYIEAHNQWDRELVDYVEGRSDKPLDSSAVGRDSVCELGKWIYSEGIAKLSGNPTFQQLRHEHSKFHQVAAEVVGLVRGGMLDEAKMLMEFRYTQEKEAVFELLKKLEKDVPK